MITNKETGTSIDEIAQGIYRICTPFHAIPGGFSLNSLLIVDDEPVLFHTGWRNWFAITREAISRVMPVERLRWVGGSHFEGDEFGATNEFLTAAPQATAFSSGIGHMTSVNDMTIRPARALGDGEEFSIGSRRLQWIFTPHVPHGWDCGVLFDHFTKTLLCGDLFTQPGSNTPPITETEVLSSSEGLRKALDYYYANPPHTSVLLEKLAAFNPATLACQHGSAYRGDGAKLLRELSAILDRERHATL